MIKISNSAVALAGAALISLAQPAFGQVDDSKLGKVHFETSCKPEAQKLFDKAMLASTRSGIAHHKKYLRMRSRPIPSAALPIGALP